MSSTTKGKAFDRKLFARVFQFVQPYRRLFWLSFALTILLAGMGVVRPLLMGDMIDDYALTGDAQGLLSVDSGNSDPVLSKLLDSMARASGHVRSATKTLHQGHGIQNAVFRSYPDRNAGYPRDQRY